MLSCKYNALNAFVLSLGNNELLINLAFGDQDISLKLQYTLISTKSCATD